MPFGPMRSSSPGSARERGAVLADRDLRLQLPRTSSRKLSEIFL